MKICIIYYSYSGVTRDIAEQISAACGGDLIEVKSRKHYTKLTVYPVGGMRASRGEHDPIDPGVIDVTDCDLLVIGTPVWAFKPTPAINAALAALTGSAGKRVVTFATCGSQAGETLDIMRNALEEKGASVIGEVVLTRRDIGNGKNVQELIGLVKGAGAPGFNIPRSGDPGSVYRPA
ncbi:MAG: ArsR family transcriptional regulator [Methanomicrobiales archaeon]|nr:ArsR family transcriptional regulator [Methanomicrobiales archaeon]NYT21566.1 ArsR family transcriptional regulator [Methanomicrobiales archaeon]